MTWEGFVLAVPPLDAEAQGDVAAAEDGRLIAVASLPHVVSLGVCPFGELETSIEAGGLGSRTIAGQARPAGCATQRLERQGPEPRFHGAQRPAIPPEPWPGSLGTRPRTRPSYIIGFSAIVASLLKIGKFR